MNPEDDSDWKEEVPGMPGVFKSKIPFREIVRRIHRQSPDSEVRDDCGCEDCE